MEQFLFYLNNYGIFIICMFIILEYSCFPLPSEIILPATGAYIAMNDYNPLSIILLSIICGLLGSTICYLIGYGGNNIIIKKIIKKQNNELNKSIIAYNKYQNISVCLGRIIPLYRTYISFVSGLNKQNYLKFIFFSSIGILIWNTTLILLGYNFFYNLDIIGRFYNNYKNFIIILFITIVFIFIIKSLIKKFKNDKMIIGE